MSYLSTKVSLFRNATSSKPIREPELGDVLDWIRRGNYAGQVERVRAVANKKERDELKASILPGVTFSGTFKERNRDSLKRHSGIVVLDFDAVVGVEAFKAELAADPHVLAAFVSPSGSGVKAVVPVSPAPRGNDEQHQAFAALKEIYPLDDLDEGAKSIVQLCFLSYDPGLYLNVEAVPVEVSLSPGRGPRSRKTARRTRSSSPRVSSTPPPSRWPAPSAA